MILGDMLQFCKFEFSSVSFFRFKNCLPLNLFIFCKFVSNSGKFVLGTATVLLLLFLYPAKQIFFGAHWIQTVFVSMSTKY